MVMRWYVFAERGSLASVSKETSLRQSSQHLQSSSESKSNRVGDNGKSSCLPCSKELARTCVSRRDDRLRLPNSERRLTP